MLPLLGLLYAVALIDRTNLGIARTAGMEADLVCTLLNSIGALSYNSHLPETQRWGSILHRFHDIFYSLYPFVRRHSHNFGL